jgi:hypothetical protein
MRKTEDKEESTRKKKAATAVLCMIKERQRRNIAWEGL